MLDFGTELRQWGKALAAINVWNDIDPWRLAVVLEAFATPLAASGFTLKRELDAELCVCCDALRIRQALMALLENAQKHAVSGMLTVRLYRSGVQCILSVEDEGPGISEEVAAYIFEAFRRGDPSRSRKSGGSGLGLAVVHGIVQQFGGDVQVQSRLGHGTVFRIRLPLTTEHLKSKEPKTGLP